EVLNASLLDMLRILRLFRFSSVPRPSQRSLINGTKDVGGYVVFEEVTEVVVVDPTKEFLSSRFSMKDMGEADIILSIRIKDIKHKSIGIAISQSHYIKKVLKKFNYFDCTLVSNPMETSEKIMPNNGQAVSQLKYSRVIDCLMYVMTYTRPDIAFVMAKLSRYTQCSKRHAFAPPRRYQGVRRSLYITKWTLALALGVEWDKA
ncbi:zinc finger, CCHC-type containing protein, partial [Tanacetum coccineum]